MPDGRMLSKSIAHSVQLGSVSLVADYLFARCLPHLDKEGRMPGHPNLVKSIACPLRVEITVDMIPDLLVELGMAGLVRWYRIDGREVLEFPGFQNHQKGARFDREAPSRLPTFSGAAVDLVRTCSGPTPELVCVSEVKVSEVKQREVEVEAKCDPAGGPLDDKEAERIQIQVQLEAYAAEHGYGPRDRLVAIGEDITAWRTPAGTLVPQSERLRMLKLADAHLADPKGKAHDRRASLRYVIAQQFDPFTVAKAEDRPPPQRQVQAHAVTNAPTLPSVGDLERKRESAEQRYATWKAQITEQLDQEPEDVRAGLRTEAVAAIGELAFKAMPQAAHPRLIEAKVLELYGARMGNPQPQQAA